MPQVPTPPFLRPIPPTEQQLHLRLCGSLLLLLVQLQLLLLLLPLLLPL